MYPAKYEYQSKCGRRYVAQGRAVLLSGLLAHHFGPLPNVAIERVAAASADELDAVGERLLTAQNLPEALG
jgi:hypothetical protein